MKELLRKLLIQVLLKVIKLLGGSPPSPGPCKCYSLRGGGFLFMKAYAGDRPPDDVPFAPAIVVDSEGTEVDQQPALFYTFSSSDEEMVTVAALEGGGVHLEYGKPKKLDDGSYSICEIRAESQEITVGSQTLKDVKTEQIQLVPGAASGFMGGGFQLPD